MQMFEEKYLKEMKEIEAKFLYNLSGIDEEELHIGMDNVLVKLLRDLGYEKIIKEYRKARKHFWYS